MATLDEPDEPKAVDWEETRKVWVMQEYVRTHPLAGDETKASAKAWDQAYHRVDEQELRNIQTHARRRRGRWGY